MDTYNKVINSKKIVIIYFYNEECLKTNIIVSKLECNLNDDIVYIKKYNIDDAETNILIQQLEVCCFPFFFIYKNGKQIDKILGTLDNVENIINLYINI
jgi:hypothetical protein